MRPLVYIPLAVAALILMDHKRNHGYWIDWADINNHDALALLLIGVWIGLMIR